MTTASLKPKCHCKLCNKHIPQNTVHPLFRIDHAPYSAQYLPTAEEFSIHAKSEPLELFQCPFCGHYQLLCEPVSYWKEVLTAAGLSLEMSEFRREQLSAWVSAHSLYGKKIMEIGCGEGTFIDILAATGAIACGLESNSAQVLRGRQSGRDILEGYLLDTKFTIPYKLDGFICINFIEHATDPIDLLRSILNQCNQGAVGIVEVPNFMRDIEEHKSYNIIRDHLSYFTPRTLSVAVQIAGFELLSIREVWHGNDLEAVVKVPYSSPCTQWYKSTPVVQGLQKLLVKELGKVAVWGASHQALTLIGMIRPSNIICIADSATFKQGKVDPVCGIPIISPDEMIELQPDLVIIIAAGYSNEIKIALNNKNYNGKIIVLEDVIQSI